MAMMCVLAAGATQAHAKIEDAEIWSARVSYVVDGDSMWVRSVDCDNRVKIRLEGIDAPEICQIGGEMARLVLRKLALGRWVQVSVNAHDRWGRAIATVSLIAEGTDLASTMVRQGWDWADRWAWRRGRHADDEAGARQAGVGLFSQAAPEYRTDFRRRNGSCGAAVPAGKAPRT